MILTPDKTVVSAEAIRQTQYRPLSATSLKEFKLSPAHYVAYKNGQKKQTSEMKLGSLIHSVILEPDKVKDDYAFMSGEWTGWTKNSNKYKDALKDFLSDTVKRTVVTEEMKGDALSVLTILETDYPNEKRDELLRRIIDAQPDQVDEEDVNQPHDDKDCVYISNYDFKAFPEMMEVLRIDELLDPFLKFFNQIKEIPVVTPAQYATAKAVRDSVMRDPKAHELVANAIHKENYIEWRDGGLPFRGFIDGVGRDYMFDIKSAQDAEPDKWQRKAYYDFKYHLQAAMYLRGWKYNRLPIEDFYFIAVEKEPPYGVSVHKVERDLLREGNSLLNSLIKDFQSLTPEDMIRTYEYRTVIHPYFGWDSWKK